MRIKTKHVETRESEEGYLADKLVSKRKYFCGYVRNPRLWVEKYSGLEKVAGLCALCEFKKCKFPRILGESNKNDCPLLLEYEKKAIEQEQRRLNRKND